METDVSGILFAKSLEDLEAAQDQVFENNLEIMTMGTQYKALHAGYILDYIHQCWLKNE